jgi:hypothetical protein
MWLYKEATKSETYPISFSLGAFYRGAQTPFHMYPETIHPGVSLNVVFIITK